MTKRVFSLLMALALCLSLLPVPALAEEAGNGATTDPVANDGKNTYTSLNEAFAGVTNDGQISAMTILPVEALTFDYANKEVTLNLNGEPVTANEDNAATLTVENGKLTLINGSEYSVDYIKNSPVVITNNGKGFAVCVSGGTLAFGGKATLTGGLEVTENGTLTGGLKAGTIITSNGKYSVLADSANHTNAASLLAPGCAFAKYDESAENKAGEIVNAYVDKLTEDVIVVAHTHNMRKDESGNYVCACGYSCTRHDFENGKCTVCGYVCPHPSDKVVHGNGGMYKCTVCLQTMVVKVTNGGTTTYYAKHFDSRGSHPENTLQEVFNKAADGSTITLLAYGLYASGWATGKNITLDLNGKNLIENNGFVVASAENGTCGKLIVTGSGASTTPANSNYPCTFRVCSDCDLVFNENFSGTYGTIYLEGGTLTSNSTDMTFDALEIQNSGAKVFLKGGTFGKICFSGSSGSVKLGDLLAGTLSQKSDKAFKYTGEDGAFVPYNTEITSSGVENVTITDCPHDSITDGTNGGTCDYCGMTGIAAVLTKPDGSIKTYTLSEGTANLFGGLTNNGGTLKLYSDLTYSYYLGTKDDTTTEMVIDLNGHQITPSSETAAVGVQGGKLTIRDSGSTKGKFASTLNVASNASLTVDGAYVVYIIANESNTNVLLKAGSKFDNIGLSGSGLVLADCLEAGSYLFCESINYAVTSPALSSASLSGSYTFTVKKVPATITADVKNGDIPYNGTVPESLDPIVKMTDGSTPSLSYTWYYHTASGTTEFPSATPSVGDTLDAFCVITAKDSGGNTLWETAVTGYTLTVNKGQAAVTKAPTTVADLTYNGSAQALLSDGGSANGGTMQYSLEQNGTYSADIPTGKDAKEYTVWYKAVGDENHEDSQPKSIKVTIAPKEVTITGTEVQPSKVYDGTTAADIINLGNLNGKENDDELTIFAGNANYSDKNVGTGKTVTFRGFMLGGKDNGNYVLKAQPAAVTADITKAASTVSAAPTAKTLTYNGSVQALVNAGTTADGTMAYSTEQNGTYSETIPTGTNAGNYTVWYKVKGDGNHNDSAPTSVSVTIAKAQVIVTAKDKSAYVNSTAPDLSNPELDKDYTVSGLFGEDKLPAAPTLKYVDETGKEIIPDMTKTGEVLIRADGNQSDNYVIVYVAGKLTVSRRSSSSSSTPSTPGKTETTTNPDGSIKITPPKNSGKVKVEIPVKDVTAGTVAIIVKPDGTEEIVKDALPTKNGIELTVDGSVTVKIVDNAKDFSDTKGHWAEDAIDFVSARGLVNGVSETNFAPNAPTTRAQLWTILARQADADLTGGSTWYEKAQAWAKASGISDGSDPNGNITRAQMVTMLWRAAGSPAVSGSSAFTDVPGDSYYAQAVAWAAEKGITTGVADGKFDPNGTCTRAQIATFLYRTYVNR